MKNDVKVEYGESFIRVGKPVVDGFIKASSKSVNLPCAPVDGDVLISLEVNGTVVARRELFTMVEGSVDVGDYTVAYSGGAVTISGTSNNDVVSIRIEPVEVVVSDAFRAAVENATSARECVLPGSNRFVVTFTYDDATETWSADKSFDECLTAWNAGQAMWSASDGAMTALSSVLTEEGNPTYFGFYLSDAESGTMIGYGIDENNEVYYYSR